MSALALSAIGQINVPVEDLERAVAFYRDVLGLRFLFQAPPGLAFFDAGGVRLLLEVAAEESEFHHPSSVIYFRTEAIDADWSALMAAGVPPLENGGAPHLIARMPDHELWMAFFRDGEGNVHALMEERR